MHSPARHRDRFPIPPHSSRFAVPALNLTMDSLLTPLFVALPSIFGLTPLSVAFTHFDGGVGVAFHFFRSLPICPSRGEGLHVTFSPSLFSAAYKPLCSARLRNRFPISFLSIIYKSLFSQLLCFVIHTKRWGVASVGLLGGRPGVAPHTPKRRTLRPRRRTRVFFSAIPCLPSAVRCQAQPLSRSPQKRDV